MVSSFLYYIASCLLLYHLSPNMVYTRIIGSRQIRNYLAGHVPPNRKLFGGTVPQNSLPQQKYKPCGARRARSLLRIYCLGFSFDYHNIGEDLVYFLRKMIGICYTFREQARNIERELRSRVLKQEIVWTFLSITSFVIANLVPSFFIANLITSFLIAYLITSFLIAYLFTSFVIAQIG